MRFHQTLCDLCGAQVRSALGGGVPTGWMELSMDIDGSGLFGHVCTDCQASGRAPAVVGILAAKLGHVLPRVQPPEVAFRRDPPRPLAQTVAEIRDAAPETSKAVVPPPQTYPESTEPTEDEKPILEQWCHRFVAVTPNERKDLARFAFGGGERSAYVHAFRAAGGIEAALVGILGPDLPSEVQARFATESCPAPTTADVAANIVVLGSLYGMPSDLRPLPIPHAVAGLLGDA